MYVPTHVVERLSQLDCEEVARHLGISVLRHKARCFMHDDHTPSLSFFSTNRKAWNCFVCRKGGNAIHLVMNYYGMDFPSACRWLGDQYNIRWNFQKYTDWREWRSKAVDQVSKYRRIKLPVVSNHDNAMSSTQKQFNKAVASCLLASCSLTSEAKKFLFDERRLSPDVIRRLGIVGISDPREALDSLTSRFSREELTDSGFVKETNGKLYLRFFTPCLLIPYLNLNVELEGLQTRYLGINRQAPRFQFVSNAKTSVFNLPIVHELAKNEDLYLAEGVTDCLAMLSAGLNAAAVPSATILPESDLRNLVNFRLHMYADNDRAGKSGYISLRDMMIGIGSFIRIKDLPDDCKDYAEYYIKMKKNGR